MTAILNNKMYELARGRRPGNKNPYADLDVHFVEKAVSYILMKHMQMNKSYQWTEIRQKLCHHYLD